MIKEFCCAYDFALFVNFGLILTNVEKYQPMQKEVLISGLFYELNKLPHTSFSGISSPVQGTWKLAEAETWYRVFDSE